jgi:hypothetical protein
VFLESCRNPWLVTEPDDGTGKWKCQPVAQKWYECRFAGIEFRAFYEQWTRPGNLSVEFPDTL